MIIRGVNGGKEWGVNGGKMGEGGRVRVRRGGEKEGRGMELVFGWGGRGDVKKGRVRLRGEDGLEEGIDVGLVVV